jgi:oligopeptidase B
MDGKEEVLIDMNALAEGKKFLRLGAWNVSKDNKLLAYGLDYDGSRRYTMFVKNLETGELLKDQVSEIAGGIVWGNDNKTIFYNVYDASLRSYKILRHTLGFDPKSDIEVFHEKDEKFDCYAYKSSDEKYIFILSSSKMTRECWFINADSPKDQPRCIEPRKEGHEYEVEHHNGNFIILTNDKAKNFRVMQTSVEKYGMKNWKEIIAHRPKVMIDDIDVFEKYWVFSCREAGLTTLQVYDIAKKQSHQIKFPEAAYTAYSSVNPEFTSTTLRYAYQSPISPNSVYDYDMIKRESVLLKRQEIPGGYTPDNYSVERFFVKAKDGAQVPLTLMYKKGVKKDGTNPALLYGYGSYGISMDPTFNQARVSLLDRGFVYAIAHIRGGGEMGKEWYENGKFLKKKNTFTDFITCAEHLLSQKYTNKDKLVIQGGSAGGLLMGAVMNMRPDLFKGVIANVPFVDVINTMMDASLPLTTSEYEEWGNPNDKKYYDYMKSYAPYENIEKKAYPHILMTTGLNDSQVPYWEPAKFAAKLRTMKTDNNLLMMKIEMSVGHGGSSGRFDRLKEVAFEYAFALKVLGITQ